MKEYNLGILVLQAGFRPWRRDKRSLKDDEKTVVGEEVTKNVEAKVMKVENFERMKMECCGFIRCN
jgi:hypothetical protein